MVGVSVVLRPLVGVPTQVEQQRYAQIDERFAPDAECLAAILLVDHLPVTPADGNDVAVVIEVSDTTLWKDRRLKLPVYARNGIAV